MLPKKRDVMPLQTCSAPVGQRRFKRLAFILMSPDPSGVFMTQSNFGEFGRILQSRVPGCEEQQEGGKSGKREDEGPVRNSPTFI